MSSGVAPPLFDVAVENLRKVIATYVGETEFVWIRSSDVSVDSRHQYFISDPSPEPISSDELRSRYDEAISNDMNVKMGCFCTIGRRSYCFLEVDELSARIDTGQLKSIVRYKTLGFAKHPKVLQWWHKAFLRLSQSDRYRTW